MVARITNMILANRMLRNMQRDLSEIAKTHEQFSTGRLFAQPTDDPIAFLTSLRLRGVLTSQSQYASNIDLGISRLQYTESVLGSVNDGILRAQELAIRGANSSVDQNGRDAIADEVAQLLDQMLFLGNGKLEGRYIFGGHETLSQPFFLETGISGQTYVKYLGDEGEQLLEIDQGALIAGNVQGLEAFFVDQGLIRSSVEVSDTSATLVTELPSAPAPSNGDFTGTFLVNGATITVEATDSLETLRDKINRADVQVTASIDDLNRLVLKSTRSVQVHLQEGTSNILQALDMLKTVAGEDIGAAMTAATTLASLGIATPEALRLQVGTDTVDIDLSSATTVGDVLNSINAAGLNVNAYINDAGTGIRVSSLDSEDNIAISDVRKIFGTAIGAGLNESTTLTSLGITPSEIEVENDALVFQVDLSSANTIGDVLNLINEAEDNGGIRAEINVAGTGINIISPTVSNSLTVREVGAGTTAAQLGILDVQDQKTATDLGLVGEGSWDAIEPLSVFQTLIDLEQLLRSDASGDEIMARHTELDNELEQLLTIRSRTGARVLRMESLRDQFLDREVFLTELLSNNEDAELTEVIVKLQSQQTSLTAALNSGAALLQTSLLNFLS